MRKGGGHAKGSSYERDIAKRLSLWWTADLPEPRDDIFWRTSGSGARATSRSKNKKKTAYEYGDITFTDPIGKPFIDCFLIECKCGYTDEIDILDLFHREENSILFYWWQKAIHEAEEAGRKNCILITARNRRPELCLINKGFFNDFRPYLGIFSGKIIEIKNSSHDFYIITLKDFLEYINAESFKFYFKENQS